MKIIKNTILYFLIFLTSYNSKGSEYPPSVGVVKAKYDNIKNILTKYKIPYMLYDYSDLEKSDIYRNKTIFFPCGLEPPMEGNIHIVPTVEKTIQSVSLKDESLEIDEEKIRKSIRSFISNGGNAYFSDYSYKLLQGAYPVMKFYDDFPNMGTSGEITLQLKDDLKYFYKKDLLIDVQHPGWIVLKSIKNSEVLAVSSVGTLRDVKTAPIVALLKKGKGQAIYTSVHNNSGNDELQRYIIYRLIYNDLLVHLLNKISLWEQHLNGTVIDSIREWEYFRSYDIPLTEGNNSIYFETDYGPFQINIFDDNNDLIIEKDIIQPECVIDIRSDSDQIGTVKIFPGNPRSTGEFALASSGGYRVFPYYKKALIIFFSLTIIFLIILIFKNIVMKKFPGKIRRNTQQK